MTTIHPSMMPAMADDLAAYNKAVALADQFSSASGWGANVSFDITVKTPSNTDISVPHRTMVRLSTEDKKVILDILYRAQSQNINALVEKIKDHYGIEVEKMVDVTIRG